ncbi:MAG TPA: glycosyltransferase [Opitutaceae bacterium]|nr:glycosyltransferase [Opitutaceae bacterium]
MPFTASVLINNYNNARYIKACVDSVLAQTVPADEVVVYDDGSTDESLSILREYGDRIRLIEGVHDHTRKSRASQSNAVYQGFLVARGEWMFLLDGDDLFDPRKIERVREAVGSRTDVSLVQSPCLIVDEHGRATGKYLDARFHQAGLRERMFQENDVDFYYPTSAMVVRREAMAQIMPLDMTVCPELACDTRIAMCMPLLGEVVTLSEPLAVWRRHSTSYISSLESSRWFQAKQTYRRISVFNTYADKFRVPHLRLWKNRRFLRQVIGALLPNVVRNKLRGKSQVLVRNET